MSVSKAVLQGAALCSSILLAAAFVCYKSGVFGPADAMSTTDGRAALQTPIVPVKTTDVALSGVVIPQRELPGDFSGKALPNSLIDNGLPASDAAGFLNGNTVSFNPISQVQLQASTQSPQEIQTIVSCTTTVASVSLFSAAQHPKISSTSFTAVRFFPQADEFPPATGSGDSKGISGNYVVYTPARPEVTGLSVKGLGEAASGTIHFAGTGAQLASPLPSTSEFGVTQTNSPQPPFTAVSCFYAILPAPFVLSSILAPVHAKTNTIEMNPPGAPVETILHTSEISGILLSPK